MREREPGEGKGPHRADLRWRPARRGAVAAALVATLIVACAVGVVALSAGDTTAQAPRQGLAAAVVQAPGDDPRLQAWRRLWERPQIELNNALVPFVQNRINAAACRRLDVAARVIRGLSNAPIARVNVLIRAGWDKFADGATACLAGNLAEAERLVREGLVERTNATEPLDEALEGE